MLEMVIGRNNIESSPKWTALSLDLAMIVFL